MTKIIKYDCAEIIAVMNLKLSVFLALKFYVDNLYYLISTQGYFQFLVM